MTNPSVTVGAKATSCAGVTQAKVTRADGSVEYHYSVPRVAWWRRSQRRWVRQRLAAFRAQEQETR